MSSKYTKPWVFLQRTPSRDNDPLAPRTHRDRDSLQGLPLCSVSCCAVCSSTEELRGSVKQCLTCWHPAQRWLESREVLEKQGHWHLGCSGEAFIMALLPALFRNKRMGQGYCCSFSVNFDV